MNCREFEEHLDAILDASAPERLAREAALHLGSCGACRELETMARASLTQPGPIDAEFTRDVMTLTSGPACAVVAEILAEPAGAGVSAGGSDLIRSHLEDCPGCSELAFTLAWMEAELPALAAIDPGEGFTAEVMRRTVQAAPRARSGQRAAVAGWWAALSARPRFAFEAAYVGAFLVWLLFGAGFSPFQQVPGRALDLAKVNPVRALEDTVRPAAAHRVWESTGARVLRRAESSGTAWSDRTRGLRQATASFLGNGAGALGSAIRGDLSSSAVRLKGMGADLLRVWQELRGRDDTQPKSQEA